MSEKKPEKPAPGKKLVLHRKGEKPVEAEPSEEVTRFEDLARKLMQVPKGEIDEIEKNEKRAKARKKTARK
jgi:hypothetical protein